MFLNGLSFFAGEMHYLSAEPPRIIIILLSMPPSFALTLDVSLGRLHGIVSDNSEICQDLSGGTKH
jgi:hypothetical protein